jgi:hypothetical protein
MVFIDLFKISLIQSDIPDLNRDSQSVTEGCIPELGGIWGILVTASTVLKDSLREDFHKTKPHKTKKAQAHPRPI